jgi:hypothetical protein
MVSGLGCFCEGFAVAPGLVPSKRDAGSFASATRVFPSDVIQAERHEMNRFTAGVIVGLASLGAWAGRAAAQVKHDSAFHALQMRGKLVMGVDQYTSHHVFEDQATGGRIALQRDRDDAEGTTVIRAHLKTIAAAFKAGDFTAPALVHMKEVPGVGVMAKKRSAITYTFRELPRGGEVGIHTADKEAIAAIHQFLQLQRSEHH